MSNLSAWHESELDAKAIGNLGNLGFDPEYGARPVRRTIQERLEDPIAESILKGIYRKGDTICVIGKDKNELEFVHPAETPKSNKSADKAMAA
jgi:ATP-dependent Clp protease ATP-binding subunit ClpA